MNQPASTVEIARHAHCSFCGGRGADMQVELVTEPGTGRRFRVPKSHGLCKQSILSLSLSMNQEIASMNTGMMWLDNDSRTALSEKIVKAAAYYRQKYHLSPDTCLVHPSMLTAPLPDGVATPAGKVIVRVSRSILPGNLWIGVESQAATLADMETDAAEETAPAATPGQP